MYTRLAFAVAAHLEPEILLVDEVLAVGDSAFQKKCLGKMETLRAKANGLLRSHNTQAVRQLCTRCVLLDHGRVVAEDPRIRRSPLQSAAARHARGQRDGVNNPENRRGSGAIRFTAVSVEDLSGQSVIPSRWATRCASASPASERTDARAGYCRRASFGNVAGDSDLSASRNHDGFRFSRARRQP